MAEDKRLALVQRIGTDANDDDEDLDFGDWDDDGDGDGDGDGGGGGGDGDGDGDSTSTSNSNNGKDGDGEVETEADDGGTAEGGDMEIPGGKETQEAQSARESATQMQQQQQQQQPAEMIKPGQETVEAVPDAAAGEVPTKSQPAQETEAQSALLPSEPAAAAAAAVSQQENGKGEESISVSPPSPALTSPPLLVVEKDADPLPKVVGEKDSVSTPAVEDNYEDDGADKEEVPNVVTAADEAPSGERKDGEDWDDWE